MSRKINAGEVVRDLKSGMHDNALMSKYNLSPGQLLALYGKLEAAGLLKKPEDAGPNAEEVPAQRAPFVCPSCGMPQARSFEECPQCGVIVAKLPYQAEPHAPDTGSRNGTVDELPGTMVHTSSGSRILLLSCVAAGLLLVFGALAFFLWPRGSGQESLSAPNKALRTAPSSRSSTPAHGVSEPMRYIKNLPRVREINPQVDAEMQRSFRDVDSSLSKGRDQLERVLKDQ